MRITFIYPSVGRNGEKPYVRAWQMEPLAIAVLASLTPADIEIRFYDDRLESVPFDEPTDLVAISVETFTALRAYRIARQFRARGVPVVLGGYHVTLLPDEASAEADAIVVGDAEPVWQQVVDDLRQGRLQPVYGGGESSSLCGLRPRRDVFQGKDYLKITLVESTRGCPHRCEFCSITAFHGGTHRCRPAREVAAEMGATGSREFFLVDDNLVGDPARARELCRELAPLGIHWIGQASIHVAEDGELLDALLRSGCRGLLIGMESLDAVNLRAMHKAWNRGADNYAEMLHRLRAHGLAVYGTFLFGYDNDDATTVERSVAFAREQKLFLAAFNHLVPFPGTPLYRRLVAEGRLPIEKWWLDPAGRIGDVTFAPGKVSAAELQSLCLAARRKFYGWHSVLRRLWDFRANCRTPKMAALFLTANLQGHYDVDLRQGLQLGSGLGQRGLVHFSARKRVLHEDDGRKHGPVPFPESMSRFQFEVATPTDDQALRGVLAQAALPGRVSVTLRREPSFFAAEVVQGGFRQTIIARDGDTGRIAGLGCRSVRTRWVNGRARSVGYLSSLRILEPYRNALLLARGYAFFKRLQADGRTDLYLTTIVEGNDRATALLTSRRAGLPTYHDAGKYHTCVVPLSRRVGAKETPSSISLRPLDASDAELLCAFLATEGPRRQFFPAYSANEFFAEGATFKDLRPADVLAAYRGGEIVGTLAGWNQRAFRQTVIEGYRGPLRWLRGVYNNWARWRGRPGLPPPGTTLRCVTAAIPVVRDDDADVFTALLRSLVNRLAAEPHEFLLVGMHESDPLLPTVRKFSINAYVARLYLVSWEGNETCGDELDARTPYLELGCL